MIAETEQSSTVILMFFYLDVTGRGRKIQEDAWWRNTGSKYSNHAYQLPFLFYSRSGIQLQNLLSFLGLLESHRYGSWSWRQTTGMFCTKKLHQGLQCSCNESNNSVGPQ